MSRQRRLISGAMRSTGAALVCGALQLVPPGTPWIRSFRALHREACPSMLAEDELPRRDAAHVAAVAYILRWPWTTTLASDWPPRRRVLEADTLTQTGRLACHRWAHVFDILTLYSSLPGCSCLGDGHL